MKNDQDSDAVLDSIMATAEKKYREEAKRKNQRIIARFPPKHPIVPKPKA